jgi:hypothetical protein
VIPPATYVLPIIRPDTDPALDPELAAYLGWIAERVEVVVVDGSSYRVFALHERAWGRAVRHVRSDPRFACANGKVQGVLTGIDLARHDLVIVADDDVRYAEASLQELVRRLEGADLVRPQNVFDPMPWHAAWDTARSLLNRALGADFPGTLGVRRSFLRATGGYDGDVLFENLELIRTVRAAGGRIAEAPDLFVRRLPPSPRRFLEQRVRQAYDDRATPLRMTLFLALGPAAIWAWRRRPALVPAAALASVLLAESGRRQAGGRGAFPAWTVLFAPLWIGERAVCEWIALLTRLRAGGVRYAGAIIRSAATPERVLRRRFAAANGRAAQAPVSSDVVAPGSTGRGLNPRLCVPSQNG